MLTREQAWAKAYMQLQDYQEAFEDRTSFIAEIHKLMNAYMQPGPVEASIRLLVGPDAEAQYFGAGEYWSNTRSR